MKTRICVIRHGETSWNVLGKIQGRIDIELNSVGQLQAQQLSAALKSIPFAAVFSSHLKRALNTAEPIATSLGLSVQACPELCERHYGIFQGLSYKEIEARYPHEYSQHRQRVPGWAIPDGESLLDFQHRVQSALRKIVSAHHGGQILLVTHGGVLDIIYRIATKMPLEAARNFAVTNAALNWISFADEAWQLESWGVELSAQNARDEFAV